MIQAITYIVSTIFTYIMGLISKKRGWNETIPIPLQNIIVGIIVFFVSVIAAKIINIEINMQDFANQIIVALGGAGTATLYYDASKKED